MSNGMGELTDEQQAMDNAVLKVMADYIVDTVKNGVERNNFSMLLTMIREYRELRKEIY